MSRLREVILVSVSVIAAALLLEPATAQQASKAQPPTPTFEDREVLPIKPPYLGPITTLDARDMDAPPVFQVTAPKGAPNVIVILVDDLGFGGTSRFGGPVPTPTFDRLAGQGIFYNQFHSTALCSPTRQALKTGRNHHSAAMGKITELATSFPGYTGVLPGEVASIGKMLGYNGYSTSAFGKWHETAVWEISPSGPMTRWPNHQGFDEFYGFLGGETNQWAPAVYHNFRTASRLRTTRDYHFMNGHGRQGPSTGSASSSRSRRTSRSSSTSRPAASARAAPRADSPTSTETGRASSTRAGT